MFNNWEKCIFSHLIGLTSKDSKSLINQGGPPQPNLVRSHLIKKPVFFFVQLNSKLSSHCSQLTRGVCASDLFNPFTPMWFLHLNFIFFSLVFLYYFLFFIFYYVFAISLWVFVLVGYDYGVEGLILGVTTATRRSRNCFINFLVLYIYIYMYVGICVFGVVECILRLWAMLKGWRCCSKGIKTED